ncbi:hypothetical protein, partial [Corynebacterium parakroppenstedtii]|uniref:hypothetical protein n=1 Tax=Corynebacterium parakroppenstedtii TaxID=2828363 RepID=UPI0030EE40E5
KQRSRIRSSLGLPENRLTGFFKEGVWVIFQPHYPPSNQLESTGRIDGFSKPVTERKGSSGGSSTRGHSDDQVSISLKDKSSTKLTRAFML